MNGAAHGPDRTRTCDLPITIDKPRPSARHADKCVARRGALPTELQAHEHGALTGRVSNPRPAGSRPGTFIPSPDAIRRRRDEHSTRTEQWESRVLLFERLAPSAGDGPRPATAFPQTITCQTAVDAERVVYELHRSAETKSPAWHSAQAGHEVSLPNPGTSHARYCVHPPVPVPAPMICRAWNDLLPASLRSACAVMPQYFRESPTDSGALRSTSSRSSIELHRHTSSPKLFS